MELIVFFLIYTYLNHVSNLPVDGICDVNFSISIIHSPHNINTSLGVDLNLEDCNFLLNYIIKIHPFSRIIGGFI